MGRGRGVRRGMGMGRGMGGREMEGGAEKQRKPGPRTAALSHTAPTCRAGARPVRRIRLLG